MNFLWYDPVYIREYLEWKRQSPDIVESQLGNQSCQNLYLINKMFSDKPRGVIHDITGHVKHPFNITARRTYNWQHNARSFDQVCLDTAQKISLATNKPIAVLWSGGIDSTVALVSLLQTVPWNRISVVCNADSQSEYMTLWQDIISPNFHVMDFEAWQNQAADYFTVSGDAGDTVWSVIDHSFYNQSHYFNTPWKDWANRELFPSLDFIEEFCTWSGRDIKTVLDLRTWFYLCCKWQDKSMELFVKRPGLTDKDATGFFDFSDDFLTWTMNNLDNIIGDTWQSYKLPAKKFIFSFHKDRNYLENKEKEYSISIISKGIHWLLKNNQAKFAIDENYHGHTLPSWPFLDFHQFEDWNDVHKLIPMKYLVD
jgi:hypothetical protein